MTAQLMRWDVVNVLLGRTEQRRFLEIGVQYGVCGKRVAARFKYGVDPSPLGGAERDYDGFFVGTSDAFFAQLAADTRFDVVLVDGLHHAEQVSRDVDNALARLNPGGFVVMHDCNPTTELMQRVPMQSDIWTGDCWKAMVGLRQRADVDAFTIDADYGIGVARRRTNPDPLPPITSELTYADLEAGRIGLLGLVSAADWQQRAQF